MPSTIRVKMMRDFSSGFLKQLAKVLAMERIKIHRDIARGVPRVVETALRDAANQRHLPAFETDPNRTAGARGLVFAAAAGSLAMAAGFTVAEAFTAMLGAGTWFEVV